MEVLLFKVEGLEIVPLVFAVSADGWKCSGGPLERTLDCLVNHSVDYAKKLSKFMVNYPQAMEFVELWALARAPKFVVDQLIRHRLASFIVSSARHGKPAVYDPINYPEIMDLAEGALDTIHNIIKECMTRLGRAELCNRFLPPLLDERVFIMKMNLREFAHIYCIRKHRGGQRETVELLDEIYKQLSDSCPICGKAVEAYCNVWGYTRNKQ